MHTSLVFVLPAKGNPGGPARQRDCPSGQSEDSRCINQSWSQLPCAGTSGEYLQSGVALKRTQMLLRAEEFRFKVHISKPITHLIVPEEDLSSLLFTMDNEGSEHMPTFSRPAAFLRP